jgi:predicted O-methyltransferase YrrM
MGIIKSEYKSRTFAKINRTLGVPNFKYLNSHIHYVPNIENLMAFFDWDHVGKLARPDLNEVDSIVDINHRRIRDAQVISTAMANKKPRIAVEIGTSLGQMTLLMHKNSPESKIFTVNAPPELLNAGQGGINTTIAWDLDRVGEAFRHVQSGSIEQVISDSKQWLPPSEIEFAFIDGCHDTEYVVSDTEAIIAKAKKGCIIVWHDANPRKAATFPWVWDVCLGIDILISKGVVTGPLYLLEDSATLLYVHN